MPNIHPFTDPILAEYYPSTNNGLPDALIPQCLKHRMRIEGLLSAASAEVRRMQNLLDAAQRAHAALLAEHLACDSLLSPIRRVPEEILSEVFLWIFDHPMALKEQDIMRLTQLQLVCKKWRNAAHSCHELWRGLDIRPPVDKNWNPNVAALQRWFSRAGSDAPLSLTLRGDDTLRHLGKPSDESLIRYLAAESRNLTHLALLKIPSIFLQLMAQTAVEDLHPNRDSWSWKTLESLYMEGNSPQHPFVFPTIPLLLPRLRILSLSGVILHTGPDGHLPSVEVLHLGAFSLRRAEVLQLNQRFPFLKGALGFGWRSNGPAGTGNKPRKNGHHNEDFSSGPCATKFALIARNEPYAPIPRGIALGRNGSGRQLVVSRHGTHHSIPTQPLYKAPLARRYSGAWR
ncbi:hypothetical protein BKA70DRAFT_691706 [Coprinopsis sp. MPI-PUGE-AT-0042]|nr:hypothetical protein BKA70DRAFT_691706 [Coprinopsis sp. MPI-PUGE-AT-0042]